MPLIIPSGFEKSILFQGADFIKNSLKISYFNENLTKMPSAAACF